MKLSAIVFLTVALLVSIAFSIPTDCNLLTFLKPVDGDIYEINSTPNLEILKNCSYKNDTLITLEVYSISKEKVVDTIVEQEYLYKLPPNIYFFINETWASDGSKYFITATVIDHEIVAKSGTFMTVN